MIKELAKINNMTEEEVKDLENNKDDYIFKDPYGNEITWTDYNIVMDLLQYKKDKNDYSDKHFKKGSLENWDMEYRE